MQEDPYLKQKESTCVKQQLTAKRNINESKEKSVERTKKQTDKIMKTKHYKQTEKKENKQKRNIKQNNNEVYIKKNVCMRV